LVVAKKISAAKAKAQFSSLLAEVAYGGQYISIERRGKPLTALRPQGAFALVGAWREVEDVDMDSLVVDIYGQREKDMGRSVELEN
jgi:antitoxin (DNA-binding transcriptional repressor) of toxin-antitoxin stability system